MLIGFVNLDLCHGNLDDEPKRVAARGIETVSDSCATWSTWAAPRLSPRPISRRRDPTSIDVQAGSIVAKYFARILDVLERPWDVDGRSTNLGLVARSRLRKAQAPLMTFPTGAGSGSQFGEMRDGCAKRGAKSGVVERHAAGSRAPRPILAI